MMFLFETTDLSLSGSGCAEVFLGKFEKKPLIINFAFEDINDLMVKLNENPSI